MGQASVSNSSPSEAPRPADWSIGWRDFVRQPEEPDQANDPDALLGHYRQLVQSSNDAIIGLSIDGVIISWNPAAEEAFAMPAERAVGASIFAVLPHLAMDHLPYLIGEALQRRRGRAVESTRGHFAGARPTTVSIAASPIVDSGEVVGVSLIARDCAPSEHPNEPMILRRGAESSETRRARS